MNALIDGVVVKYLKLIPDERGLLMEILRCDEEIFEKFGQVYLSVAYPNVVKAWHWHKLQTDHFAVVKGMAKVALYDQRKDSPTYKCVNEFFIGERNPILLKIPKEVMHGYKAVGEESAYLINVPTFPYNRLLPDEERVDSVNNDIPYKW